MDKLPNWLKQKHPGWQFWLAVPVFAGSALVALENIYLLFFPGQAYAGLGGLILFISVPLLLGIAAGYFTLIRGLASRSYKAYIAGAFMVPIGYWLMLDELFQTFAPGPNYSITPIYKNGALVGSNSIPIDKMAHYLGDWPSLLWLLFFAYAISAWYLRKSAKSHI